MNPLVYHVASGHCFFTGIALLIAAALCGLREEALWQRAAWFALVFGALAVVISSTAIPYWLYAVAVAATLPWFSVRYQKDWQHWAPHAMIATWLFAATAEVPYHAMPPLKRFFSLKLTVLGDSVTAGVDGDEKSETWPKILAREQDLDVQDISHVDETAASRSSECKRLRQLRNSSLSKSAATICSVRRRRLSSIAT